MDPHRLSLVVEHSDGRVTRWGPDELDGRDVPLNLTFGTSIPGGFSTLTCNLLREINLDHPDQGLFDTVKVLGAGNKTVWEGRMQRFPRSHGDSYSVSPAAVGWSAHLKDDTSFREIYVDRNLSSWSGPSAGRRLAFLTALSTIHDPAVAWDPDAATQALHLHFNRIHQPGDGRNTLSEAWYDGHGITLGEVYADVDFRGDAGGANWHFEVGLSDDDETVVAGATAELTDVSADATVSEATTATTRKFGFLRLYNSNSPVTTDGSYSVLAKKLTAYGKHGLTQHGSAAPFGYYASDVVADIVSRAAPLLNYTTGTDGTIEPTSFTIPHLTFPDPTTADDAILRTNAYHLYEWGVYDDKTFFMRQPDPDRLTWKARLSEGVHLDLEGDDADHVYNGVIVNFTNPSGQRRTAGPTGSGMDVTSADLLDDSETNPVNRWGIPRRWAKLDVSQPTTDDGATQIGAVYLAERSLPQRRGAAQITGLIEHPTAGLRPAFEVRAGDYISFTDGGISDTPRRVLSTTYNHQSRTLSVDLDNSAFKLEAILDRIGISLVGVI